MDVPSEPTNDHPQPEKVPADVTTPEPKPEQASHPPTAASILDASKENPQPREVTFRILLHCVPENTRKEKSLTLNDYPKYAFGLKESIQNEFSIPACCQRLYFESILIGDSERLDSYRIRDGDTFHVHYNSEGDVEDILEIISSIRFFVESIQLALFEGVLPGEQTLTVSKIDSLNKKYFEPFDAERASANRLLFVCNNGLELMHQLHVMLLQQSWEDAPLAMQYLELGILSALSNITCSFSIRTLVLKRPTLDAVVQSLLRVKVQHKAAIVAPYNEYIGQMATQDHLNHILHNMLYWAAVTICNLADLPLPECRLRIASNMEILEQFIAMMLTQTYSYIFSQVTVTGMLSLAYSLETHPYLTQPKVIEGVMEACEIRRSWTNCRITEEERRLDLMLLRYSATMFFAQLVTSSPHLLGPELTLRLYDFVKGFLEKADYREIQEHEVTFGCVWSTVAPSVKLAYTPYSPYLNPNHCTTHVHADVSSSDVETMRKFQELCVEAGIFSLQNMLSCASVRKILVEEGLVEYVTCLPWCTLPGSRAHERATELASALGQKMQLHPPRLGTLTRAKLAAWCFGLEKVLQTLSVHELLAEVYQSGS